MVFFGNGSNTEMIVDYKTIFKNSIIELSEQNRK